MILFFCPFSSVPGRVRRGHRARMVVAHPDDARQRHGRQLRGVADGRGHGRLAVRRRCRHRGRARRRRVRRVRPPRVADRRRGARRVRLADDRLPEGHAHAIRGPDPAGRRVRRHVRHRAHVRRRDRGARDTR